MKMTAAEGKRYLALVVVRPFDKLTAGGAQHDYFFYLYSSLLFFICVLSAPIHVPQPLHFLDRGERLALFDQRLSLIHESREIVDDHDSTSVW
jgi:hypothetical protein